LQLSGIAHRLTFRRERARVVFLMRREFEQSQRANFLFVGLGGLLGLFCLALGRLRELIVRDGQSFRRCRLFLQQQRGFLQIATGRGERLAHCLGRDGELIRVGCDLLRLLAERAERRTRLLEARVVGGRFNVDRNIVGGRRAHYFAFSAVIL
jgi:hypothetical protein